MEYTPSEKQAIINKYLHSHGIKFGNELLEKISQKSDSVPRNIYNLCVKIRDYVVSKNGATMELTDDLWSDFLEHLKIEDGGITPLHRKYLEILEEYDRPM
jgi:Holliday junction resolvasome RuvABC ATP-dependent DNA helicase subunit